MLTPDTQHRDHALVPYAVFVKVWALLIALTVLTVAASYVDLKHVAVLAILLIATVKGTLVVLYFMHVRFESRLYAVMILVVLGAYVVFIGLTFVDYGYR